MLHPDTLKIGSEAGYPNGFAWYVAGRGGVLGDVDADVIVSAFAYFNPKIVRKMWLAGRCCGRCSSLRFSICLGVCGVGPTASSRH